MFPFLTVVMNICNVHVLVNLEFLLVLANVFTSALSAETSPASPSSTLPVADKSTTPAKDVVPVDQEPPELSIQLSVKDPEIVLLADAKDKDTNALFLKVIRGCCLEQTVVRCVVVWCGVVWCGVVLRGMVWCGVWCVVWCSVV